MIESSPNINFLWARLLIGELVRCGVAFFQISPGSRSTPLALVAAEHPKARSLAHFDERGAAFHALGHARATGRPVALICTSGSAVANYWPAVVEAAQSHVPLLLLTADRPPELTDCGANQAISQSRIYGDYVRWRFDLPCPDPRIAAAVVLTTVDQAVHRALGMPPGPVHLNCPFREPLAPLPDGTDPKASLTGLGDWFGSDAPYVRYAQPTASAADEDIRALAESCNHCARGVLVVGRLRPGQETKSARTLASALQWPVFADVASGLRLSVDKLPVVPYADQALLSGRFRALCAPDMVLRIGGPVTSKRLNEFLAMPRAEQWLITDHPSRQDPAHRPCQRIEGNLAECCAALVRQCAFRPNADWAARIQAASAAVAGVLRNWEQGQTGLSEPLIARLVSSRAPERSVLFLGNSMPIRDMDMFGLPDGPALEVVVQRGASGIDGNTANAAGYARATGRPLTAVIGDLAALHDLNSLALLRGLETPFALVVTNNDGGGIFSFLPVAGYAEHFEDAFGTPHGLTFEAAAAMFGLRYAQPAAAAEFVAVYHDALAAHGATIIEVRSDRGANAALHAELQREITAALERACG